MIATDFAKQVRRIRTERRDLTKQGWVHVGERGGSMWELYRGSRIGQRITDVRIAADGISLWIKCAEPEPHLSSKGNKE